MTFQGLLSLVVVLFETGYGIPITVLIIGCGIVFESVYGIPITVFIIG